MASSLLLHPLLSLSIAAPASSPRSSNPCLFLSSPASSSRLSMSGSRLIPGSSNSSRRLQLLIAKSSAGEDAVPVETEASDAEEGETPAEEAPADASKEEKPPRKPRIKLGDIMGILNKRAIEEVEKERTVPDIRVGDIVEIKLEVPENRRRASTYKGIVMSKQNAGIHTTIRIRRIIAGVGVEIVFPVYSPNIKEIKVVDHRKVRRARLYYLRDKLPRLSTFK